jgi:hypothetical protein
VARFDGAGALRYPDLNTEGGRAGAGAQPRTVPKSMEPDDAPMRLFTVDEANALLPSIKDLLAEFNTLRRQLLRTAQELETLEQQRDRSNILTRARNLRLLRERLGADREATRAALEKITTLGVQVKGLEPALIDFPSRRGGRIVLLCWQEGEPGVGHWHDIEDGFAGRQPL